VLGASAAEQRQTTSSKETAVNTIHALVVRPDNTTERIEVPEVEISNAIKSAIGNWFDHVTIQPALDFWVDDEGLHKGLPLNKVATRFYEMLGASSPIVGTVVFTGGSNARGETLSLDENYARAIEFMAQMANEF
jgi:hypothetical protein